MEINFGKIELENLINVVTLVKRTKDCGQDCQWFNIKAETVVCGDKEVNKVFFGIIYNMNDRLINLHIEDWTWSILWENNDISFDDVKKLFKKIAAIDKDEDGFFVFENVDEIIELGKMYKKKDNDDISYSEYIEYVKNYINK